VKATEVTAGPAESNGSLLPGLWRDSLHVTCGLTACTPGSAPCPTLGNECGKTLPFYLLICLFSCYIGLYCTISSYTGFAVPTMTSCLYSCHVVFCACGLVCHRLCGRMVAVVSSQSRVVSPVPCCQLFTRWHNIILSSTAYRCFIF